MRSDIFRFESDFAGSLRCIPMTVRLKLDLCGIKLSLKQWSRMAASVREDLLTRPCDDAADIAGYRTVLAAWLTSHGEILTPITADRALWQETELSEAVSQQVEAKGAPPLRLEQWQNLSELQRVTLLKLTRPGHENENFLPALKEFGLA